MTNEIPERTEEFIRERITFHRRIADRWETLLRALSRRDPESAHVAAVDTLLIDSPSVTVRDPDVS
jgi:hypothetical protein